MATQGQPNNSSDNDTLQATVSGGWNIVDTALTIPSEDSADLLNVDVDVDGSIVKRRGFSREPNFLVSGNLSSFTPFQLRNGYNVILFDNGTNLYVAHRDLNDVAGIASTWQFITGSNVFGTDNPLKYTTDTIISNEPLSTRIILLRPYHIPIQVQAIEAAGVVTLGAPGVAVTVNTSNLFSDAAPDAMWCWVDGVFSTINTFVYGGGTSTINLLSPIAAGTHTIHAVYFTYQCWSEGNKIDATQAIQHITQGATEKHKAIPTELLRDVAETTTYGKYPIEVLASTNYDNVFARAANFSPAGVNDYTFSAGAEMAAGFAHTPSPFYVSFGAAPGAARAVVFTRGYSLANYNGGNLPNSTYLAACLYNNTTAWQFSNSVPPSEGGAGVGSNRFAFRTRNANYLTFGGFNFPTYISFDSSSTATGGLTLPQDDIILFGINDTQAYSTRIVGTNYTSFNTNLRRSYNRVPYVIFGIQDFCVYSASSTNNKVSFPSTGCVYQRRLVLGGMPLAPNILAFSEVQDQTIPGQYYRNFQTTLEDGTATNGFIVQVPTENNERIVVVREFQGSLFVWTNLSLYRITGLQGVPFSDGNFSIDKIAAVGCISQRSIVTTSTSLYWISRTGVYALKANDTAGGYGVVEVSRKIRPFFLNHLNAYPELASYLTYDANEQRLYVGVPSDRVAFYGTSSYTLGTNRPYESDTLLVYHESNDAWTRYSNMGGLNFYSRGLAVEYTSSQFSNPTSQNNGSSNLYWYGNDTQSCVYIGKQPRYIDQTGTIYNLTGTQTSTTTYKRWVWSCVVDKFIYDPSDVVVGDAYSGLQLSKVVSLEDCLVFYGGAQLTFGTDYYKTVDGAIALTFNPTNSTQLYVLPAQRVNDALYPMIGAYKNDEPQLPGVDYTISTVTNPVASFTGLVVTDVIRVGTTYPSYHISPAFTRATMLNWKRIKQWAGFYDNAFLGDRWKASTVGTRYQLIGINRNFVNFDIVFLFNNEQDGYIDTEVYESSLLQWDVAQLSLGEAGNSYKQYARLTVPIIGGGYTFQFMHYNNANSAFKLSGYQILASIKPGKGTQRT